MAAAPVLISAAALLLSISLLAGGAAARPGSHFHPCKTVLISYYDPASRSLSPFRSFAVFRVVGPAIPARLPELSFSNILIDRPMETAFPADELVSPASSLEDRATDILFVLAGLLFGVGCGALIAATASLLSSFGELCDDADDDDEEEDVESPKKMGYFKIVSPAPFKEGYEAN